MLQLDLGIFTEAGLFRTLVTFVQKLKWASKVTRQKFETTQPKNIIWNLTSFIKIICAIFTGLLCNTPFARDLFYNIFGIDILLRQLQSSTVFDIYADLWKNIYHGCICCTQRFSYYRHRYQIWLTVQIRCFKHVMYSSSEMKIPVKMKKKKNYNKFA